MEKRVILAVLLMSAVIIITNLLFPPPERPVEEEPVAVDTPMVAPPPAVAVPFEPAPDLAADTVVVSSPLYRYGFSTRGAALVEATLLRYPSYVTPEEPVQMVPEQTQDLLAHRVVIGRDTVDLRTLPFQAEPHALELQAGGPPQELRFTLGGEEGFGAEITYTFQPNSYLIGVRGRLVGLGGQSAALLTELGPGLAPHEHPAHRSERQQAVVARTPDGTMHNLLLERVQDRQFVPGPLVWAGVKDKYFLISLITGAGTPFEQVVARDVPDERVAVQVGRTVDTLAVPRAEATTVLPIGPDGEFAFSAYVGPQEHSRLVAVGYGLQEVNPYGYRWLRPVIRPIAAAILWVLDQLHDSLGIGYGWVLVIFGVLMRVVLWPLNAKAMRAQMKNMAVQPLLQERMATIREKYKDDPQRQQKEMMAAYQELGMSPFSMFSGCLPLLIPMPVLITLFFVFQDSIAFRGESFLWLPDLSLADPLYILPIFLVISMFLLQWLSAKLGGMEQNPQMKMMMYFMPLMIGFIFFMLPSGLNLYYATTNVATLPQQILIAKERRKAQEAMKEKGLPIPGGAPVPTGGGGGKGGGKKRGPRRAKKRS